MFQIRYSPVSILGAVVKMAWRTMLWAVNANWNGDGWNVNAYSVENRDRWNAGNSVCSRYSLAFFSSVLDGGVFASTPFLHAPTSLPIPSAFWPI